METKELKKIGEEMLKQSNRHTQFPLFVVQHEVERRVNPTDEDYDIKERWEDYNDSYGYCEECEKLMEKGDPPKEECDDCDDECFVFMKVEKEIDTRAGTFLTAKACEEHISENNYHYQKPRSYAISAWRNEEMQLIMKNILSLATKEIPNYYC